MMKLFRQKKKKRETTADKTDVEPAQSADALPSHGSEPVPDPPVEAAGSDAVSENSVSDPMDNPNGNHRKGFFSRLRSGLKKTRDILTTDIDDLFLGKRQIDDDMLEDLEELLITSDMGVHITMKLVEGIRKRARSIAGPDALKNVMKEEILGMICDYPAPTPPDPFPKPYVVMVLGVNGVGKTTTIGKLAARAVADGKKVLIAASDTFRAAATEQLTIWAERAGADIVSHREGADPAAVAYDGMEAALSRNADMVFIDTAGRLHTKVNLMEELKKIKRTIAKKLTDAPHEVLLVLDATTGQNALSQAAMFNTEIEVSSLALTKLDGTAKGGIVVSICSQLKIPLKYIGVGEQIDDLQEFDPEVFVEALFTRKG